MPAKMPILPGMHFQFKDLQVQIYPIHVFLISSPLSLLPPPTSPFICMAECAMLRFICITDLMIIWGALFYWQQYWTIYFVRIEAWYGVKSYSSFIANRFSSVFFFSFVNFGSFFKGNWANRFFNSSSKILGWFLFHYKLFTSSWTTSFPSCQLVSS